MSFLIRHDGTFTGFKGYFVADLSDTVAMDVSGDDIAHGLTSDSWKHCCLPVEHAIPVWRGDRLALSFSRCATTEHGSFGQQYRWAGTVLRDTEVLTRSGVSLTRHGVPPRPLSGSSAVPDGP